MLLYCHSLHVRILCLINRANCVLSVFYFLAMAFPRLMYNLFNIYKVLGSGLPTISGCVHEAQCSRHQL